MKNVDKIFMIIIMILTIVALSLVLSTLFKIDKIKKITEEIKRDHKEWLKEECSEMGGYYLLGEEKLGEEVRRIDCINGEGEVRVKYYIRGEEWH